MKITRAEMFLKHLVDTSSPTTDQPGVAAAHEILAQTLKELGFKIEWVKDPSGTTENLLVAERRGANLDGIEAPFVTMVSHIDTVLPPKDAGEYRREMIANRLRARGAGIIDNKGGLAVLVESLKLFFEAHPKPAVSFRVVSSPDEENGSSAWHSTFRQIGHQSKAVLGFEPALDDGSIISSRRGNRWYNIEIAGIAAHAGRCKGEEINAAHEAARLTVRLLEARDRLRKKFDCAPGLGVSLHVGHVEGGRNRHNVVCEKVSMKLDTRFSNFDEREALHTEILQILTSPTETNSSGEQPVISFEIVDDCPPFDANVSAEAMVGSLCEIIARLEGRAKIIPSKAGGAGDVNHMSRPELLILDGLGPVGGNMHTIEEYLELSTLQTRAQALAEWYPALITYCRSIR